MPYIYTTAEELSRTGLPIVRPLFLEFPNATVDLHPIDIDAGNEFLFGRDLLVAPAPFPDKLDSYVVELPSVNWYNYWTGEKINRKAASQDTQSTRSEQGSVPNQITIQPSLETLPVFVREGAIIPVQPLVQSTNEKPQGPLTLRVYPGKDCKGSIYLDDGRSFSFQHGEFMRMDFRCEEEEHGLMIHLGPHQGNYTAWWNSVRVEVYGTSASPQKVVLTGRTEPLQPEFEATHHVAAFTLPDDGHGSDLHMQWTQ